MQQSDTERREHLLQIFKFRHDRLQFLRALIFNERINDIILQHSGQFLEDEFKNFRQFLSAGRTKVFIRPRLARQFVNHRNVEVSP